MSESSEQRLVPRTTFSTIAGAAAGGIVAAFVEAGLIVDAKLPFIDALVATTPVYLLAALAVGGIVAIFHVAAALHIEHRGRPAVSRLIALCIVVFGAGLGTWGVTRFMQSTFGSPDTHAIGLGIVSAGLSGILLIAAIAIPKSDRTVGHVPSVYALAATAAALLATLGALNPGFVGELRPLRFVLLLIPAVGAIVAGAHLPGLSGRLYQVASRLPVVVGTVLGIAVAFAELPTDVRLVVERSDYLAGTIDMTSSAGPLPSHGASAEGTATCKPGSSMPSVDAIEDVAEDAPDIILLTVDSLRFDHTSLSDYSRDTTPQLAARVPDGAVFTRAYPPASSTRQTFRGLFTGMHPSLVTTPKARRWALALPDGQETLASYLRAAGYSTAAIMTATKTLSSGKNALHGFDVVDESPRAWWDDRKFSAPLMIDRIIAHLSNTEVDQPKFAWAHLMEPHQRYRGGPDPKSFGKGQLAAYDSAIHFVDGEIGRMIDFVRSPARRENTWLFITADHGHAFKEHGNRFHGHTVYEEEIRVPLIVFGPGVNGARFDVPTSLLDIFPTLLSVAGIAPFDAACGNDLKPTLLGKVAPPKGPVFVEQIADSSNDAFHVAWFDIPLKLLLRPTTKTVELYDLSADPDELDNLATKRAADVARLKEELSAYLESRGMDPNVYGLDP